MSRAGSIALPRLRVRRRRPPSPRRILSILFAAETLGWLALCVVKVAIRADFWPFYVALSVLWIAFYLLTVRQLRRALEYERVGRPLQPVSRGEWLALAAGVMAQAACWATVAS